MHVYCQFDLDGMHTSMAAEIAPSYTIGPPIARAGIAWAPSLKKYIINLSVGFNPCSVLQSSFFAAA